MPPKKRAPITLSDAYIGVTLQDKRHDGVWHVRWRDPITGLDKSRKAGTTAEECQTAADEAIRQLNGGRSLRNPKAKVWDVLQDWITREVEPNKSFKTLMTYKPYCETHFDCIADKPIGNVSAVTLEIILERLEDGGASSAVRGKVKTIMQSFFKWAKKEGYILHNPASDLPVIVNVRVKNIDDAVLTMREMLFVAYAADFYYGIHIKTLALAGLRIGELAGIRRQDCWFHNPDGEQPWLDIIQSFDRHSMKLPKNGKTRFVYIPQELADEIEQHIARQDETGFGVNADGLVFSTKGGSVLHDTNFRVKVFRVAYESAVKSGLVKRKVSTQTATKGEAVMPFPHILRHGTATTLREHGVSEHNASSHLGHGSIAVTKGYTHETHEGLLKAAQALEEVLMEIDAEAALKAANEAPEAV